MTLLRRSNMIMKSGRAYIFLAGLLLLLGTHSALAECIPTKPDMLGPFYKPDAPVRSSVGTGYLLRGTVMSSRDCSPVKKARLEFWLAGPDSEYDEAHRATTFSGPSGAYRFESNLPQPYGNRPPHIHLRISADGFKTLVTQHYPDAGKTDTVFDIVLEPS